jgi:hypothetical protein
MKLQLNKNTIVSALLLLIAGLIIYRIAPVYVPGNLTAVISKNGSDIRNINQARDIIKTHSVKLDKLNLYHKGKFGHPKLGNIAKTSDDFFLDVDQMITINKEGNYQFLVGSDDGFSLTIDNKKICEHPSDRPYSIQSCNIFLTKGKHRLQATYFQGFGNSGFTLQYRATNKKIYWFGENSADLTLE